MDSIAEKRKSRDVRLKGPAPVWLAANVSDSVAFYGKLGFVHEVIGGHSHVTRGDVTFILHPARSENDVRPASSAEGGLYFDAFCYTDAAGLITLYEEWCGMGVDIVDAHLDGWWKEFVIRDLNGYRIAFGGAEDKKEELPL